MGFKTIFLLLIFLSLTSCSYELDTPPNMILDINSSFNESNNNSSLQIKNKYINPKISYHYYNDDEL